MEKITSMQCHDAFCGSSGWPGLSQQLLQWPKEAAIERVRPPVRSIGADASTVTF